jgi:hypothetical protein
MLRDAIRHVAIIATSYWCALGLRMVRMSHHWNVKLIWCTSQASVDVCYCKMITYERDESILARISKVPSFRI